MFKSFVIIRDVTRVDWLKLQRGAALGLGEVLESSSELEILFDIYLTYASKFMMY